MESLHLTQGAVATVITFIILIVSIIWSFAKVLSKLEAKPTSEEVKNILDEELKHYATKDVITDMIEEKFENHCPFKDRVEKLEMRSTGFDKYIKEHAEWGLRENAGNRELLQELILNVKNICNVLKDGGIKIEYLKKNGS